MSGDFSPLQTLCVTTPMNISGAAPLFAVNLSADFYGHLVRILTPVETSSFVRHHSVAIPHNQ